MAIKFTFNNRNNLPIVGDIFSQKNPQWLAFILHGLGGFKDHETIQLMSNVFLQNGYNVVIFDATNSIGESWGKYENATMQSHYEDLVDVIEWAKSHYEWYQKKFTLAWHSLGAYAILRYAEEHNNEVKAVFAFAPVISGTLSFEASDQFKQQEISDREKTWRTTRSSRSKPWVEIKLPWSHMQERLKHDLLPQAWKLNMTVLLLVGENDESCPPAHQKILYDLIPGPKEFHIVTNAPHSFRTPKELDQLSNILDFWLKNIKPE